VLYAKGESRFLFCDINRYITIPETVYTLYLSIYSRIFIRSNDAFLVVFFAIMSIVQFSFIFIY